MRTNSIGFIFGSEKRKNIVKTLFEYPKRQWSCSALEDLTKISHATVFRTLSGLRDLGILRSNKINKKDMIYELVSSPLTHELERMMNIDEIAAKKIISAFVNKIKKANLKMYSAILYGSAVKGTLKPESDLDVLIVLDKRNQILEEKILNIAAEFSSKLNRTLSAVIMGTKEINKEKNKPFIKSVRENMELIYGKKPF